MNAALENNRQVLSCCPINRYSMGFGLCYKSILTPGNNDIRNEAKCDS